MSRFFIGKVSRKVALVAAAAAMVSALVGVLLAGEPLFSRGSLVFALATLVGVSATLVAMRHVVIRPLRRLRRVMGRAEGGDFLIRAPVDAEDEIGDLARQFNVMLARITDMAAVQIDAEREKAHMQRELALKAELAEKSEELSRRVRDLSLLIDVTKAITSTLDVDEVLASIRGSVDTLGFREFALLLYEEGAREYVVRQASGFPEGDEPVVGLRFSESEGVISLVHERRDTVLVRDASRESRYLHYKGRRPRKGSLLLIPMKTPRRMLGALSFARPEPDGFSPEEVRLLETVAAQATLAINNARLYQRTLDLTLVDPLTTVYNRRALHQRLEMEVDRSRRFEQPLSVLMVDLDTFKAYNDRHGHPAGDEVLRRVAEVLRDNLRRVDTVARYGGEEFTVILARTALPAALEVAEKLRREVERDTFPGEGAPGAVTLSVGVSSFPDHAMDPVNLLERADAALYHAKSEGRNRVAAWTAGLEAAPDPRPSEDAGDDAGHRRVGEG